MNTVDIILASVEFGDGPFAPANMFKIIKDLWWVHTCQEGNSRTCPGSISIVAMEHSESEVSSWHQANFEMIPYKAIRIIPFVE
jgi:hypothetical protein